MNNNLFVQNQNSDYNDAYSDEEDNYHHGPLITEEEEHEIRQVASDINERAFYGKLLNNKKTPKPNSKNNRQGENPDDLMNKILSPRAKEIGSIMQIVN